MRCNEIISTLIQLSCGHTVPNRFQAVVFHAVEIRIANTRTRATVEDMPSKIIQIMDASCSRCLDQWIATICVDSNSPSRNRQELRGADRGAFLVDILTSQPQAFDPATDAAKCKCRHRNAATRPRSAFNGNQNIAIGNKTNYANTRPSRRYYCYYYYYIALLLFIMKIHSVAVHTHRPSQRMTRTRRTQVWLCLPEDELLRVLSFCLSFCFAF